MGWIERETADQRFVIQVCSSFFKIDMILEKKKQYDTEKEKRDQSKNT